MNEQFNYIDKIIKEACVEKKEASLDIDKHPIDKLDILIAECNSENYKQTIESIKEIIKINPELIEELLDQIDTQKKIAELEREKSQKIENGEARLEESLKWSGKLKALNKLNLAVNEKNENLDGDKK